MLATANVATSLARSQNNRRSLVHRETRSCRDPSMSVHIVRRSAPSSRSRLPVHSHISRGRSRSHSKARLLPHLLPHHLHVLLPNHLMRWIAPSAAEVPFALGERVAFKGVARVGETYAVVFAQRLQRLLRKRPQRRNPRGVDITFSELALFHWHLPLSTIDECRLAIIFLSAACTRFFISLVNNRSQAGD